MTAALLRWWTVPRLNSHSNPSSTGESSTAKKLLTLLPKGKTLSLESYESFHIMAVSLLDKKTRYSFLIICIQGGDSDFVTSAFKKS